MTPELLVHKVSKERPVLQVRPEPKEIKVSKVFKVKPEQPEQPALKENKD
ncbi:hypothetical protein [Arenibacter aquaticus]|nr:hypothetical protein [Arenibacter aquaticus]